MTRYWFVVATCGLIAFTLVRSAWVSSEAAQDAPASSLVRAAEAFASKLDEPQKQKAMVGYDSKERVNWQFVPLPTRKGLPMMEMNEQQQQAARDLLKVVVSQIGYEKATKIMSLENVLRTLEGPQSHERRNPLKYYFTIYGKPGANEHWGLSIEGHHLSLNFVMQGDKVVDSTPQFFASNPAELKKSYGDGFDEGLRVLRDEETIAFELLASLSAEQKEAAMIPGKTPTEIRGAAEPQPPKTDAVGIKTAKLNDAQKAMLKKLMKAYTDKMRREVAEGRWQLIEKAGFDNITFAWSGADRPGVGHYYRLQGPTFLVEFINVQADAAGNPANHIHCVWRDMDGDFDLPIGS